MASENFESSRGLSLPPTEFFLNLFHPREKIFQKPHDQRHILKLGYDTDTITQSIDRLYIPIYLYLNLGIDIFVKQNGEPKKSTSLYPIFILSCMKFRSGWFTIVSPPPAQSNCIFLSHSQSLYIDKSVHKI